MDEGLKKVSEHMYDYGINTLARAIYDVTFSEMTKPYCHAHAIPLSATAAEIIIKARIAKEHPLLIFENLPKSDMSDKKLSYQQLFEKGKTIQFHELPERLWAVTGYKIKNVSAFIEFGKIRNTIMHFAVPDIDLQLETYRFGLEIMDPIIQDFISDSVLNHVAEWDDAIICDGYLQEAIERHGIKLNKYSNDILHKGKIKLGGT